MVQSVSAAAANTQPAVKTEKTAETQASATAPAAGAAASPFKIEQATPEEKQQAKDAHANSTKALDDAARNTYDARKAEKDPVLAQRNQELDGLKTTHPEYFAQEDAIRTQNQAEQKAIDDAHSPLNDPNWFANNTTKSQALREKTDQQEAALEASPVGQAYNAARLEILQRYDALESQINQKYLGPQIDQYKATQAQLQKTDPFSNYGGGLLADGGDTSGALPADIHVRALDLVIARERNGAQLYGGNLGSKPFLAGNPTPSAVGAPLF